MFAVLLLFLLPVGGGIPGGVLLAQAKGFPWWLSAGLYLVSDLILAVAFEPILRLGALLARRSAALGRFRDAWRIAAARTAPALRGTGAGPMALVLVAFGVDPMTGRASALAAGHGFVTGWAIAITGDLLYYAVVAFTTLGLNRWVKHPEFTVALVMLAMIALPVLVRRTRRKPS